MVGIADLPVTAIHSLKNSVQKSAAERAAKASPPPTIPPKASSTSDLSLDRATLLDSAASSRTDLSATSTINDASSGSDETVKTEEEEFEPKKTPHEGETNTHSLTQFCTCISL